MLNSLSGFEPQGANAKMPSYGFIPSAFLKTRSLYTIFTSNKGISGCQNVQKIHLQYVKLPSHIRKKDQERNLTQSIQKILVEKYILGQNGVYNTISLLNF